MKDFNASFKGLQEFKIIRQEVSDYLHEYIDHEKDSLMIVVVNEAINNAILHGNKGKNDLITTLRMKIVNSKLIIRIKDQGNGFSGNEKLNQIKLATNSPFEDNNSDSGRGLFIMASIVDCMTYNRYGNELVMVKRLGKSRQ